MPFSPKQIESFNDATARINFWFGAVRSGKTFASIFKLIDEIKNGPPGSVMIVGVNRDSIQRNVLVELYNLLGFPCPSSKATEAMLYGRHVYFVGAHDESSVRRIQGSTLAIAYVDEAPCIPAPFWKMLLSRLSVKGAKLLATGNPEGPYHWMKREFLDRQSDLDLKAWHFQLDDNPSLDEKYKESLKKEYSGMWYKRYILGEWAVAEGLIFSSFDEVNIYENPTNNPTFYAVGVDYGTTNATAAVLAAINPRVWPQIRIESEYYWDSRVRGRSKTDLELAEDLKAFVKGKDVRAVYVDPAAASLKLELRRIDLPVIDANNDVLLGIKITDKFISGKNLVVHKSCQNLIQQIQTYSWCPKAADRGEDKPLKVSDHICFVEGSMVATPQGQIPIEELNEGDNVITRNGKRKILKTMQNIVNNNDVISVYFGNILLTGTYNHPIWTEKGWLPLNSLNGYHTVCLLQGEKWKNQTLFCLTESHTENTLTQKICPIVNITAAVWQMSLRDLDIYIETFGSITTAKSQRDGIFTTLMEIPKTIRSKILNACRRNSTSKDIRKAKQENKKIKYISKTLKSWRKNGILHLKGLNGIANMRSKTISEVDQTFCFLANVVKKCMKQKTWLLIQNSAPTNANQNREENQKSITSIENVSLAKTSLDAISMQNENIAAQNAAVLTKVYNLEIEEDQEYFVNGLLVHNCDATRYLCASAFPNGEIYNPTQELTYDELRKQVYGDDPMSLNSNISGYF